MSEMLTESLFVPKDIKDKDIWLVRGIDYKQRDKPDLAKVTVCESGIWLWFFGSECEEEASKYEFIRKISIPELSG